MPVTKLNFVPAIFSSNEITGFVLNYESSEQLRSFEKTYKGQYLFRRDRNTIRAVPLVAGCKTLPSDAKSERFTTLRDTYLFSALLKEGVRELLRAKSFGVAEYGRIHIRVEKGNKGSEDLVPPAIKRVISEKERAAALKKAEFLHIYRRYFIEAAYVGVISEEVLPQYGLLFDIGTAWQIHASIKGLIERGINVIGCYASAERKPIDPESIGNKSYGCIARIEGEKVWLVDYRDQEIVDATTHYIEGSLDNFTLCVNTLFPVNTAKAILREIRQEVFNVTGAPSQQERIQNLADFLAKSPITCALGLTATLENKLFDTTTHSEAKAFVMSAPSYSLGYTKPPITTSIASAIAKYGPFDQDSFAKIVPHILVITPKLSEGSVEQFLRQWKDGIPKTTYQKGFIAQYRLRGCDFRVEGVDAGTNIADQYIKACNRGIDYSHEQVRRFDLAFVVVEEKHRHLGNNDPYLVTKAALMGHEIPVQVVEIETIKSAEFSIPYILNNIALACYAKLGGTPWALASARGQGITHELIVGLGSAIISDGRFQEKERYVGITTLFNYDGVYLLSNISEDVSYDQYPEALQKTLLNSIQYVSIKKGWQRGDKVRLIFHTFKPLKEAEIDAIKNLVAQNLAEYTVDFAFLTISHFHDWRMYNTGFPGVPMKGTSTKKGKDVSQRGTTVVIGQKKLLLSMTGASELKTADQGCPRPIQLTLQRASTFQDIEYLARQVFEFTYMSWKTYNLGSTPVTIQYSDEIAALLGRLRRVKNWNANALQTSALKSSLWFL